MLTEEEIIEGNRLVGWFDEGYKQHAPTEPLLKDVPRMWNDYLAENGRYYYHQNWNLFMPAAKKFSDYLQNIERPSKNHCCKGDMLEVDVTCAIREYNLPLAFSSLVKCIKWYNTQ